jgi:hypothetical protein
VTVFICSPALTGSPLVTERVPEAAASLVEWFGQHALLILGALAAGIYALLRLAYLHFYYAFNVAPEEVGLGRAELLSQALIGPVLFVLLVIVSSILITVAYFLVEATAYLARRRFKSLRKLRREPDSDQVDPSSDDHVKLPTVPTMVLRESLNMRRLPIFALMLIIVLTIGLFTQAYHAADGVKKGYTITTVNYGIGRYNLPVLNIVAWYATIEWKPADKAPSMLRDHPACIIYLGKANGTTVVYNVRTKATIRFSSGDAVIAVHPSVERLNASCYN